jgi:hypothetical protein
MERDDADDVRRSNAPFRIMLLDRREFLATAGAGLASAAGSTQAEARHDQPKLQTNYLALVIAVDKTPGARDLRHTIDEARQFVDWLIRKGGVRHENITLLVSANHLQADFFGVKPQEATGRAIIKAVMQTIGGSQCGPDDRLYFYFTGHGVLFSGTSLPLEGEYRLNDAIASSDHDWIDARPISVAWVQRWFASTSSREQFFVIDACRELRANGEPRKADEPGIPVPSIAQRLNDGYVQYFLYPVVPGEVAFDNFDGSFAHTLLDGLRLGNNGAMKLLDGPPPRYVVCWKRLVRAVKEYFRATKPVEIRRRANGKPEFLKPHSFALPLGAGDDDADGPQMTTLQPLEVSKVALSLTIQPPEARRQTQVILTADGIDPYRLIFEEQKDSIRAELPPLAYKLEVEARDYILPGRSLTINLSHDLELPPITLVKKGKLAGTAPLSGRSAAVTVSCSDRFAQIRIYDGFGKNVKPERVSTMRSGGELSVTDLQPGRYSAHVTARPDAEVVETFDVSAGERRDVHVDFPGSAPTTLSSALERALGNSFKRIANEAELNTITCPNMLLAMTMLGDQPFSEAVASALGFKQDAADRDSVRIVVGVENNGHWLEPFLLRPIVGSSRSTYVKLKRCNSQVEGVAVFMSIDYIPTGAYVLSMSARGTPAVEFPVMKLDNRRSDVVVYGNAEGRLTVSQFAPLIRRDRRDRRSVETLALQSRLQCDLSLGHAQSATRLLSALQDESDPITTSIQAYISLGRQIPRGAANLALTRSDDFRELPDLYVYKGVIAEAGHPGKSVPKAAAAEYAAALDRGLPLLLPFLEVLWDAIRRDTSIAAGSRYTEILRRIAPKCLRYQLWSAWPPERV